MEKMGGLAYKSAKADPPFAVQNEGYNSPVNFEGSRMKHHNSKNCLKYRFFNTFL